MRQIYLFLYCLWKLFCFTIHIFVESCFSLTIILFLFELFLQVSLLYNLVAFRMMAYISILRSLWIVFGLILIYICLRMIQIVIVRLQVLIIYPSSIFITLRNPLSYRLIGFTLLMILNTIENDLSIRLFLSLLLRWLFSF